MAKIPTMSTYPAPHKEPADEGLDLARIAGAFRRRLALFLTTVVIVMAIVVAVTFTLNPRYSATATLLMKPQEMRILESQSVVEELPASQVGTDTPLATEVSILSSRAHAERVVEELNLAAVDEFRHAEPWLDTAQPAALLEQVRSWTMAAFVAATAADTDQPSDDGVAAPSPAPPTANAVADGEPPAPGTNPERGSVETAIDLLLKGLSVHRDGQSQAVVVRYSSGDPALAAAVANAVVDLYLQRQLDEKTRIAQTAETWVRSRLEMLRDELLAAEREVEQFRAIHDLQEDRGGSLVARQVASLNSQLIEARAEQQALEARLRRIRDSLAAGGFGEGSTEVAASPVVGELRRQQADLQRLGAQLSQEYGAQHPRMLQLQAELAEVQRKMADEIQGIAARIAEDTAFATQRVDTIEATLADAAGRAAEAQQAAVELRELERDATARRAVYQTMLGRLQEIQEQRDLLRPDAQVLSNAAVPERPSFPQRGLILVVGLMGSMGLGVVLVTIAELLDRRLRSAEQIEQALGLNTLALVPKVSRLPRGRTPALYLADRPLSAYAEALREVETALPAGTPAGGATTVLVTSSLPGEGKTTLAASLALTAARGGRRTIIVDLDVRNPSVEPALGLASTDGVAACVLDGRPLSTAAVPTPLEPNLRVLGNSSSSADGQGALVRSPALRALIGRLRSGYDLVILDSPPLLGLADTKVVVALADQVLFVVQWEQTATTAARSGLRALQAADANVTGAVLTHVNLERHARYGYADAGSYYGRYQKYYVN
jgi:polysaccharide biosynthesis transport protein